MGASAHAVAPAAHAAPARPVIVVDRVVKSYAMGDLTVHALRGVSLRIERGDYVAIMGSSGSGKSTLMNILGCLDTPTSGSYLLDGIDVRAYDDDDLADIRNRKIGFVFQSFNLVPRTRALAQVELPLAYAGVGRAERRRRATRALRAVGMGERLDHLPSELSGGQQQRVAVARALVASPPLLLADEPTGNLDSRSTEDVLAIFDALSAHGRTIVLITHEHEVAERARRVIRLIDGRIVEDRRRDEAAPAALARDSAARDRADAPGNAAARARDSVARDRADAPGSAAARARDSAARDRADAPGSAA